jgi:hypothetical protein
MCRIAFVCKWNFSRGDTGGAEAPPATHLRAPPPPSPPRRRLSGRRTSVRPQGRRRRGPTSLLFSSLPPRDSPGWSSSSMASAVVPGRPHSDPPLGWPDPRHGRPDLPPRASACRRAALAAAAGPGSQLWRAAVREPGSGSRGWPHPPSWSCGVCLASSRGARSARRTSRGGRPDPRCPFSPKSVVS